MKKLLILISLILVSYGRSQAICTYQKSLAGEEFPIGLMLSWSTAWEENTASFIIERAGDGVDFEIVGTVPSAGNSTKIKSYNFLDSKATAGSYYRLKQADIDGSFRYSAVVRSSKSLANNFLVSRMSNLSTKDRFTATIEMFIAGNLRYELREIGGLRVFWATKSVKVGLNDISIDLSDYKPGNYKLKFLFDNEEEIIVLQKLQVDKSEDKAPVVIGATMEK
ncbi:MAG: hypothetical protein ACOYOA_00245 [Saprospiraceae bacterium]